MKKVIVNGLGYVGLVHILGCWLQAYELQEFGIKDYMFIGIDPDRNKIGKIKAGIPPIHESGLEEILKLAIHHPESIQFTSDTSIWYDDPEVELFFCCVGTPMSDDGSANMQYVYDLARNFGEHIGNMDAVFINKSTSLVGTCDAIYNIILGELDKRYAGGVRNTNISVLSNPEFLKEGTALDDMLVPDRLVIGGQDEDHCAPLYNFYHDLDIGVGNTMITSTRNAEMIKYASNAMLATRISFVNDLADLCEKLGTDIKVVTHGMGLDRRIGESFLQPGPGYGGSCFPKDTVALAHQALSNGVELDVVRATITSNEYHKRKACYLVEDILKDMPEIKKIGIVGMAFKNGTNDMRESSSVILARWLVENTKTEIHVFDDNIREEDLAREVPCDWPERLILSPADELGECDLIIIMNDNDEYLDIDSSTKVVLDMRCCLSDSRIKELEELGILYIGHGYGAR